MLWGLNACSKVTQRSALLNVVRTDSNAQVTAPLFRSVPGFLLPDSHSSVTAILFFLFSSWVSIAWIASISYNSTFRSVPAFSPPAWRPSVVPFLFPFSLRFYCPAFVHVFQLSCLYSFSAFLPRGSRPWLGSLVIFPFISYVRTIPCESLAFPSLSASLLPCLRPHLFSALLPPGSPITCKTMVLYCLLYTHFFIGCTVRSRLCLGVL